MVKISKENIISSLLVLGFENVSPELLLCVLNIIKEDGRFEVKDDYYGSFFRSAVDYDELGYRLKPGCTLDTDVSIYPNQIISLKDMLNKNDILFDYLRTIDYRTIIMNKAALLGYKVDYLSNHYCAKEREIIADMFGIDDPMSKYSYTESVEKYGDTQSKKEIAKECLQETDNKGIIRERKKK